MRKVEQKPLYKYEPKKTLCEKFTGQNIKTSFLEGA